MPFVSVTVAQKLTAEQITAIKTELGQSISVIAGKNESGTLVKIDDSNNFFKGGEAQTKAAFVEVRLYGKSSFEDKETYNAVIFKTLSSIADIEESMTYVNFLEMDIWGSKGVLNTTN